MTNYGTTVHGPAMATETFNFEDIATEPDAAAEALFGALYYELRRVARYQLSLGGMGVSMSATTLLHKAYIDMADGSPSFCTKGQFVAYASRVMRGHIVDHARRRYAKKRSGAAKPISYTSNLREQIVEDRDIILINDALDELAEVDTALVALVTLKFFCGLSFVEIAAMHGVSERTVQRGWEKARIYLHQIIRPGVLKA